MNTHARIEHPEMRRRAVHGVFWSYLAYGIQFLVQTVALVVLARQLNVSDFGVFAIGLMIVGVGETLFRMGFGPSLVQLDELRDEHIDVAWTSNLVLALAAIAILGTGTMLFIADATTRLVVLVMLSSVLLNSVMSPGLMLLQRNLQTRDFVGIATVRVLVRYLGAILAAVWMPNCWALVSAFLGGFAVEVAMTYLIAGRRPRLLWRRTVFLELFHFSRWLHLKNITRWGARYLDPVAVGALLGVPALGLYNRALNLAALPNQQSELLSFRVFFPMFASAQKEPERLARLVGHAVNVLLLTALPVLLVMTLHGPFVVRLVLGEKWSAIDSVLGLLALGLLFRSLNDVQSTALRAVGQPRFEFINSAVQVALTGLALVPCILWFGLPGAAVALIAGSLAAMLLTERFMRRHIGASIGSEVVSLGGTALGALAAYAVHSANAGWGSSLLAVTLRAATEVGAFFAVQIVLFLATRRGILRSVAWAANQFLARRQQTSPAPLAPQPAT